MVLFVHETRSKSLPPVLAEVISLNSHTLGLTDGMSVRELNERYGAAQKSSVGAQLVCAEMEATIDPTAKDSAAQRVAKLELNDARLQEAIDALALVGKLADKAAASSFKLRAHERFPYATAFAPSEQS